MNRLFILFTIFFSAGIAYSENEFEGIYLDIPSDFEKGFEEKRESFSIEEWIPSGESVSNWTRMITLTIQTLPNLDPLEFFNHMADGWAKSCPEYGGMLLHEGSENNYPIAIWFLKCPENPNTGKPEFTYVKGISGNDYFYTVQLAFANRTDEINDDIVKQSMNYLRDVGVCDGRRLAVHPCD